MKLDLFKEVKNTLEKLEVQDFLNELSDYLKNFIGKINDKLLQNTEDKAIDSTKQITNDQTEELNYLRQEDCLYYVVDANLETAYLQNLNIDVIFEEVDLPEELKGKIFTDCILRYKNGEYIWEKEMTDEFLKSFISISEYKNIKEEFIMKSKIEEKNADIRYKILSYNEEKETTTLYYVNNGIKEIEVPNQLLPQRVYEWKILYYEDGKFKTDIEATKESYEKWKNNKHITKD